MLNMIPTSRSLTLVAPGLLGPPGLRAADFAMLNCAALELLLARATLEAIPAKGLEATLFNLMGVPRAPAEDLPIAAVAQLAEMNEQSGGPLHLPHLHSLPSEWWIRADPVHLRADQSRLVLMDSYMLSITRAEADALVAQFNAFFSDDGWCLQAPHPERWYLRLPQDPRMRTYDVTEVLGRHIDGFLPSGAQGKRWHTILNEIQMLFHTSPVNQAREMRGAAPINSVWLWGGGCLPRSIPSAITAPAWSAVLSNEPVAKGLAHLAGIPHAPLPESAHAWLRTPALGPCLLVLDNGYRDALYGDASAWGMAMEHMAAQWFTPLVVALKQRQLDSVSICTADGRMFRITPASLWRFWKRRRSLEVYTSLKPHS